MPAKDGEPPRLVIEEEVERSAQDVASATGGPVGRYKLMSACRLVRWLFEQDDDPTRVALGDEARKQGLGEDTVNEALRLLEVRSVPPAERGLPWKLVCNQPDWPVWLKNGGL
jgi:hypothetical protein